MGPQLRAGRLHAGGLRGRRRHGLRLAITPNEFLDAFRSWVKGPLDGADALVRDAQRNVKVGCLSNTNPVHWEYNHNRWDILDAFDVRLLSFEMGCVKPDRETFDRVAQRLDCLPSRVLFLDDNAINVEGATAAGFRGGAHGRRTSRAA